MCLPPSPGPGRIGGAWYSFTGKILAELRSEFPIIDEAQVPPARDGSAGTFFEPSASG